MLLVCGDVWAVYERGWVWCLVRETCEYHSRGEEGAPWARAPPSPPPPPPPPPPQVFSLFHICSVLQSNLLHTVPPPLPIQKVFHTLLYMVLFWRDHSRLEGYSVCPGEACLCQLLTNLLPVHKSALCLPKTMSCLSWLPFD